MEDGAPPMFKLWLDVYSEPSLVYFPHSPKPGQSIEKEGKTFRVVRIIAKTTTDDLVQVYGRPE